MAKPTQKVIRARRSFLERFKWITEADNSTSAKCREAALVDGAIVERALEDLIRSKLPRLTAAKNRDMFGEIGILGTFSLKIRMAHVLGLLGPDTKHDLEKVKEIRNIFAHVQRPITFRNQRVRVLCGLPRAPKRYPPDNPRYVRMPFGMFKLTVNILAIDLSTRPMPGRRWRTP